MGVKIHSKIQNSIEQTSTQKRFLTKSKNVLKQKHKKVKQKICMKKKHVYNTCFEILPSVIKNRLKLNRPPKLDTYKAMLQERQYYNLI